MKKKISLPHFFVYYKNKRLPCGGNKYNYTSAHEPRYTGQGTFKKINRPHNTLKVVTYNIKFSKKIDQAIHLFENHMDLENTDLLFLQEMDHAGVEKIADNLNYNYVYYPAVLHPIAGKDFGNAILSKWPISDDRKLILPQTKTGNLQRIAVGATIAIEEKKILAYSIHLKVFLKPDQRKEQMLNLLKSLPGDTEHCIVAGDFNTFSKKSQQAIIDPFHEADFIHASKEAGWTYHRWYLLHRKVTIDKIFTKGLDVLKTGKVPCRKASDHYPVWAEVKI